jgi:hypothetical protein
MVLPLAKTGSDHVPLVVNIDTNIPKARIFRFDSYWVDLPGFAECVKDSWNKPTGKSYSSAVIVGKLKTLRYDLKKWHTSLAKLKGLIENCNKVILLLDNLEEKRPLFRAEFNFRRIVKLHLESLLLAECNYWRKRCTIHWIKQGEDNTKFFHAMATERFHRNTIALLHDASGNEVSDHESMAGLLWSDYKGRMGRSDGIQMQFDLSQLLQRVEGLDELTEPFSRKEIDDVIKAMPSDRAPGPDGFNGLFLKKCWPIIKYDYYRLVEEFQEGSLKLANINGSYITLVPKKPSPLVVSDYRPISLTNVSMKILTKLAANRLQGRILDCIHKNQYGFLRSRSIQDCLAWSFEYIHLCHVSKRPIVILKLDFAKAFDTVEHAAIIEVMRHKGFNEKWLKWAMGFLSTEHLRFCLMVCQGSNLNVNVVFGKVILFHLCSTCLLLISCSQLSMIW